MRNSALLALLLAFGVQAEAQTRFEVTCPATLCSGPVTGRLVIVVARSATPEPRLTVAPEGPAIFGIDVEQLAPGAAAVVTDTAAGYPMPLSALPAGDYFVQAVIDVYERVKRSDGHTIWVRINDGRRETFQIAAGNLVSEVQPVRIGSGGSVRLTMSRRLSQSPRPPDTEWVKHVQIQSRKLTDFWGRPIFVNATLLLPKGYAEHPDARYPSVYTMVHNVPFSFTTDSANVRGHGVINATTGLENGFDFYKSWVSDGFPRFIAISFEQQTPYFPDSYSVNSANNGPYGDAIVEEIIPFLEERFRIIRAPYARLVEGASTGGWQALALQLQHPDFFGGAWVLQPDPIDFRRYLLTNIYEDTNAFVIPAGRLITTERPFRRSLEGQTVYTVRQLSRFEDVLGSRGRSSYQLMGWDAVYGPVGTDGYPRPLWNKRTGTIDRDVANAMRERGFDLREYAQRNWPSLGPKLAGKLHFFTGDMDDFHLNLAVYQFEEFLKNTTNPRSDAEFTYGRPMKGHSWHAFTWAEMVRRMGAHVKKNAPAGASTAWIY